jgi:hypothetical protein
MDDGRGKREYAGPRIADYGSLESLTATIHPVFGTALHGAGHDLSFSGAGGTTTGSGTVAAGGGTPEGAVLPATASSPGSTDASGSSPGSAGNPGDASGSLGAGASGGGSSGGGSGGGGGGDLPFTGFASGAVAAAGAALTATGVALRRVARRRG